ncbi:hydroxyacylglutathione hydrolase [Prosthecobacter debontii]|uniref:Hydroxyacylglutathione hydrolase n=1 Tax=Prosthecobacter debontii TaxID=48467 RepID=A0A1T4WI20_9BACT|nr:MBL fold metallo-hydrolase [Prosthecobacter debontii]SKA76986.1 hydroxyacylglutathione hydrolase [Prosthecobacter debontii]
MFLRQITDAALAQNAYLIGCQRTGEAVIVDPERDVDRYLRLAAENDLRITAVAETHIHADYLSGARELVERHGVKAYLSREGGPDWQFEWAQGHLNARFLSDGDSFKVGNIELKAVHSPGHTPEHLSFLIVDHGSGATEPMGLLSGDFIFVGDVGRPDLLESAAGQAGVMEPSARTLYASLRAASALPEHLQILPAHGAGSACGKALGAVPTSVMGYERRFNAAFKEALTESEDTFVKDILAGQPAPPLYFARMKQDNKKGPALLPQGRLPRPKHFSRSEVRLFLANPANVVLDLRSNRQPFMQRHLAGALLAPLAGGKLPIAAGSYVAEDAALLLVVNDESEVVEAVRQLIRIGLDHVVGWITVAEALHSEDDLIQTQAFITTAQLYDALQAQTSAQVLDVRGADEYAERHVQGALNIPYTRLAARLAELPRDTRLYVHCGSGLRASLATAYLAREGFDAVLVDGSFGQIAASLKTPAQA